MRLTIMAAIAALSASTLASAQPAPAPADAKPEAKLICKRISDDPSDRLSPRHKICKSAEEWKQAARDQSVQMPQQQTKPTGY